MARTDGSKAVAGTPPWAVATAWATFACVVPSCAWRLAVGYGAPLGWHRDHLRLERIPGYGTFYVTYLSVACLAAAALTLGLIRPWGERIPERVGPFRPGHIGGRSIPALVVAAITSVGAAIVVALVVASIAHWPAVSGFRGRLTSPWALLMEACYAPAILWPVLLMATLVAYLRRRRRTAT